MKGREKGCKLSSEYDIHTYVPYRAYHALVSSHERQRGHTRHRLIGEQSLPG